MNARNFTNLVQFRTFQIDFSVSNCFKGNTEYKFLFPDLKTLRSQTPDSSQMNIK